MTCLCNSLDTCLRRCSSRTFSPGLCPFVLRCFRGVLLLSCHHT